MPGPGVHELVGPDRAGGRALSPRGWLAVAATLLGIMLWASDGHLGPGGVPFLVLSWAAMIAAFTSKADDDPRRVERVLSVGVLVQLVLLVARPPGQYLLPDLDKHLVLATTFPAALGAITILSTSIVLERPLLGRATFPTLVAVFGAAAAWVLVASPHPWIDVIDFGRESALALARGENPYDLHLPNIYGNTELFGPGFATDRTIDVGLVYPPLSLFLTATGWYLVHDPRGLLVVALIASAVLIDRLGGRTARLAALLFISSPRRFFVLEQGWTEPFLVAMLALVLLLAQRRSRWLPVGLAALLGLKQFAVLLLPLTPLLLGETRPRRSVRVVGLALLIAGAFTLPFVLWDPSAFFRSTVLFHLAQPFRPDSLGFAALWAWARGGKAPPTAVPTLVLTGLGMVWALRRCKPTPAGFAAGSALVLLAFLAWSKQAHCNYYDLAIGLLICAVAAGGSAGTPATPGRTVA